MKAFPHCLFSQTIVLTVRTYWCIILRIIQIIQIEIGVLLYPGRSWWLKCTTKCLNFNCVLVCCRFCVVELIWNLGNLK